MYVEDVGSGPPVLAVPGLGGGAWFFAGFARRLAADYRVLSIDLPGTGRSAAPGVPFSAESWVADLGDLLTARVTDPVVIIGHSLGTILALQAWQAWAERIRGLVFVGGLPEVRPLIRERLSERARLVAAHGLSGWGHRAATGTFARATFDTTPELIALFERLFEAQDPQQYTRACEILLSTSAAGLASSVPVPCLALTGSEDQYAPPDLVTGFAGELQACRVEILSNCGHLPFLEAPEAFAGAVRSYLSAVC